jgi:HAD superfamily hydrolase (TIGR01662 family)
MEIKAVILDFGGTLASGAIDWDEYHEAIGVLLVGLGYNIEISHLKKAIASALKELQRIRSRGLEMTYEEVYGSVLEGLGIIPNEEILGMAHGVFKKHYVSKFYPCTEEVLRKLHLNYKLALISNTMSDQPREQLEEAILDSLFEVIVCSRDLGVRKPNPEIFKHVLGKLGVEPSQTVHVGDSVEADMLGAENVGITPIWIKTQGQEPWHGRAISSICQLPQYLEKI